MEAFLFILAIILLVVILFFAIGYVVSSMALSVGVWIFVAIIALLAAIVYFQDN